MSVRALVRSLVRFLSGLLGPDTGHPLKGGCLSGRPAFRFRKVTGNGWRKKAERRGASLNSDFRERASDECHRTRRIRIEALSSLHGPRHTSVG